jgi:hypothetical protein
MTDTSGHFTIATIPPGDYKFFSWESAPNGAYYDPAFLRLYEASGIAVHVGESSTQDVSVRMIPAL